MVCQQPLEKSDFDGVHHTNEDSELHLLGYEQLGALQISDQGRRLERAPGQDGKVSGRYCFPLLGMDLWLRRGLGSVVSAFQISGMCICAISILVFSILMPEQIHVDKYKMRLYRALRAPDNTPNGSALAPEAAVLAGFTCGNTPQLGCLTTDNTVRIHSCGKGMNCPAINDDIVWIQPIVTRTQSGAEIAEMGVGGGGGDLSQRPEIDLTSPAIFQQLLQT